MSGPTRLAQYRSKRDFAATPEPSGLRRSSPRARGAASFVVQLHHARSRHFDFRLQVGDSLRSWAIPKGPSLDSRNKRLAVEVEDHPLAYGRFEGEIPQGEYGAGKVDIWDRGTWSSSESPAQALASGHLRFTLHGERLRGAWSLVRTRLSGKKRQWLLIKVHDEAERAGDEADDLPLSQWRRAQRARKDPPAASASLARRAAARLAPGTDARTESVRLTHPDRVLLRQPRITKGQLADFYSAIADFILPGLINRPLMLLRCPQGGDGPCFFQKHIKHAAAAIHEVSDARSKQRWIYIEDLPGLLELVQINALEYHVWGSTVRNLERVDQLVFDLDPGAAVPWKQVIGAALELREFLDALKIRSFVRTSGGKGLHILVPVQPPASWPVGGAFARAVAERMAREQPQRYLAAAAKAGRTGRIFIDYLRNARGSTAVCSYSMRNRPHAPVATPLTWEELPRLRAGDQFCFGNIRRRLARLQADPWADVRSVQQSLPALRDG
jgi:bifunctional non-homologous end joining protein LigD